MCHMQYGLNKKNQYFKSIYIIYLTYHIINLLK